MSTPRLSPAQLGDWLSQHPPSVPPPPVTATAVAQLRQQSADRPAGLPDPQAQVGAPAGEAGEPAVEWEWRQQLKRRLAALKLHAGLVGAALGQAGTDGESVGPQPTADPAATVTAYVERATRWIEATTAALDSHWATPTADSTAANRPGVRLSGYHRYEIARVLVGVLQQRPAVVDTLTPAAMADHLAQSPVLAGISEPPAAAWVSAGPATDLTLAWSRAQARVLEAAIQAPFKRPLAVLLADARAAISAEVERQVQVIAPAPTLSPDAMAIVRMHALQVASQLYAATLVQVHHASTRLIQTYHDHLHQGNTAAAAHAAQAYQDQHLGYVGVPHHFQALAALHTAALGPAPAQPLPASPLPAQGQG